MNRNTFSYKLRQILMFAGPGTILFFAVVVVPFIYGLYLTFTSWDGVSANKPFVGFANYAAAFSDGAYWIALGRTALYSLFAVVFINRFVGKSRIIILHVSWSKTYKTLII